MCAPLMMQVGQGDPNALESGTLLRPCVLNLACWPHLGQAVAHRMMVLRAMLHSWTRQGTAHATLKPNACQCLRCQLQRTSLVGTAGWSATMPVGVWTPVSKMQRMAQAGQALQGHVGQE
jgi:hypothetical protein